MNFYTYFSDEHAMGNLKFYAVYYLQSIILFSLSDLILFIIYENALMTEVEKDFKLKLMSCSKEG